MKNRFLCLFLAVLMFATSISMSSCSFSTELDEDEKEEPTEVVFPVTLTLWLPAAEGSEIDDESVVFVENAINEYTQSNFKTAVKLKVFPAEQYDSYVLSKIYEIKDAEDKAAAKAAEERRKKREQKKNATSDVTSEESSPADTTEPVDDVTTEAVTADTAGTVDSSAETTAAPDTTAAESVPETTEGETSTVDADKTDPSKYILPADKDNKRPYDYDYENSFLNSSLFTSYPQVESDQFDIFLIHGYEEFKLLYGDYLLSDLTSNYENESKLMKSFINDNFIKGVKYEGSLSVIPNNRAVGKSQVMLINKKVCKDLSYDASLFTKVDSLFDYDNTGISFIEDVIKNAPGVTPVAGEFKIPNVKYFSETDDDTFSVISAQIDRGVDSYIPFISSFKNIFEQTAFVNNYKNYKRLNSLVNPVRFESADNFAVGFVEGTYEEIQKYKEDYQIVTLQEPQLTRDDAFATCFAVSSYTQNLERAMQIITAINTNTELRTILQYGKQGVHWRYDMEDTNIIRVLNDKYKMDITETGNSFITYPGDGRPISDWVDAKNSNKSLYTPYSYGMVSLTADTAPLLKEIAAKSKELYTKIQGMSYEEFNTNLESLKAEVRDMDAFQRLTYPFDGSDPKKEEDYNIEQSLPQLFNDYATNTRGW